MKKLIIIGLIAVASMVFTGCKDNENEDKKAVSDQVEDSVTDNTDAEDITDPKMNPAGIFLCLFVKGGHVIDRQRDPGFVPGSFFV